MITAGSLNRRGRNHFDKQENGISYNHAYTVLSAHEYRHPMSWDVVIRLLKIRNPWGIESYNGPYSDKSELWKSHMRKELGAEANNDGIFFMPIEEYKKSFESTTISHDPSKMSRAHFLVLNDSNKLSI